jgi:hypothetical protein
MNSTIPVDLLELKARFETWRTNRKYVREPIPEEFWNAAADLCRRYPTSLVGRVLKLDSSKLKRLLIKRSARTSVRKKLQASFRVRTVLNSRSIFSLAPGSRFVPRICLIRFSISAGLVRGVSSSLAIVGCSPLHLE